MSTPIAIEIGLSSGVVLRGHEWSTDGPPVLFIHDLGEDLDVWSPVPATLARSGFRVVSVELRGHGLSDGEVEPDSVEADVADLIAEVAGSFGPVALVTHGAVSEAAQYLGDTSGAPVHVMVSPQPLASDGIDWKRARPALRLVIVGTGNEIAKSYAEGIYPKMRGQNMWLSTATDDQGPALVANHISMVEHIVMFIRRYLTGHHLAWIAEHADEIKAAAAESTDQ